MYADLWLFSAFDRNTHQYDSAFTTLASLNDLLELNLCLDCKADSKFLMCHSMPSPDEKGL